MLLLRIGFLGYLVGLIGVVDFTGLIDVVHAFIVFTDLIGLTDLFLLASDNVQQAGTVRLWRVFRLDVMAGVVELHFVCFVICSRHTDIHG